VEYSPRRISERPFSMSLSSRGVGVYSGNVRRILKYVRRASRMSSERVRCSAFRTRSTSMIISGGREIVMVCRVLIGATCW